MQPFSFEHLEIWKLSRILVKDIYNLTKLFPAEEKFELTSQLRSASVSVSSNIVEGNYRLSAKNKAYFIEMAYGSLMEMFNQLILACDLGFIEEKFVDQKRPIIMEIGNKLNALHKSTLKRQD